MTGFNSIFAVASIDAAKLYYSEFQRQMEADPARWLKVALIYSFNVNEPEAEGFLDEENSEDTSRLDAPSRDFLEAAIADYNAMFQTSYDTTAEKFQNYYKDVSLRMKNREIDLLIVVNMFLTGFDATTLNTLWVDKNLRYHGLLQAYSRTNVSAQPAPSGFEADSVVCSSTNRNNGRTAWDAKDEIIGRRNCQNIGTAV